MKDIFVKFHLADSAYITALRLVAGAVCAMRDTDLDAAEDFKVCATESALILKNCGFESAEFVFSGGDKVVLEVRGKGGEPHSTENEFSLALISALVSSCDIGQRNGIIEKLTLTL